MSLPSIVKIVALTGLQSNNHQHSADRKDFKSVNG